MRYVCLRPIAAQGVGMVGYRLVMEGEFWVQFPMGSPTQESQAIDTALLYYRTLVGGGDVMVSRIEPPNPTATLMDGGYNMRAMRRSQAGIWALVFI